VFRILSLAVLALGTGGFVVSNAIATHGGSDIDCSLVGTGSWCYGTGGNNDVRKIHSGTPTDALAGSDMGWVTNGDPGSYVEGSGGQDYLEGDELVDTIKGGPGSDWWDCGGRDCGLQGSGGLDDIYGGDDADLLTGGSDTDTLRGEVGWDKIFADDGTRDYVHGGDGTDQCNVDTHDQVDGCES
jgi:hypothetical protein